MSGSNFDLALQRLQQACDSKSIFKALSSIRSLVDWPKNRNNITKLGESECLKRITGIILIAKHKHIIDVSLSILGNCCMDRNFTSELVSKNNILSILNQLLKKYPKKDSINGRTFRIIGNMCQHGDLWSNLIVNRKPQIVSHIVDIVNQAAKDYSDVKYYVSKATMETALRALRELIGFSNKTLLKQFGVLKAVGALFIKYTLEWINTKENEKLLINILKVFEKYSTYSKYHWILEMQNTDRGNCFVHLPSVLLVAPKKVVNIIIDLSKSSVLLSEIPIPQISEKFIEALEKRPFELDENLKCYLECIDSLLFHTENTRYDRCGQLLPPLMKILKEVKEPTNNKTVKCCILIINALNRFQYCGTMLLKQINWGIMDVLIEKFRWFVEPDLLNLNAICQAKRKYMDSPTTLYSSKKLFIPVENYESCSSPNSSDDEMILHGGKFKMTSRSPSPCSSSDDDSGVLSWSEPSCSPKRSLQNDSSDSDNYSPVCSEVDESEFPISELDDDMKDTPDNLPRDQESEASAYEKTKNISALLKYELCEAILVLTKSYAHIEYNGSLAPELVNIDFLFMITNWVINKRAHNDSVLFNILQSREYVIPIMKSNFIQSLLKVKAMEPSSHGNCADFLLNTIAATVQIASNRGEIAHQLLRGDKETKENLALVIPYIIRDRAVLRNFMVTSEGLEILMNLLREDNEQSQKSLKVLCHLASNCLLITNPRIPPQESKKLTFSADHYKYFYDVTNAVHLEFDDGTIVDVDRDFLIEKSDFFAGLLNGHFRESKQSQVSLLNADSKAFKCILYLLQRYNMTEAVEIDMPLDLLLNIILLCDRYLLVDLCVAVTNSVEQFRIDTNTVPEIYNWSIISGTNILRIESVAYALVASVDENVRYKMFKELFNLGYKEQLIDDMKKLLIRYLNLSDFNQRVKDLNKKKNYVHLRKMRESLLKKYV